jgi:hypothetical protein
VTGLTVEVRHCAYCAQLCYPDQGAWYCYACNRMQPGPLGARANKEERKIMASEKTAPTTDRPLGDGKDGIHRSALSRFARRRWYESRRAEIEPALRANDILQLETSWHINKGLALRLRKRWGLPGLRKFRQPAQPAGPERAAPAARAPSATPQAVPPPPLPSPPAPPANELLSALEEGLRAMLTVVSYLRAQDTAARGGGRGR